MMTCAIPFASTDKRGSGRCSAERSAMTCSRPCARKLRSQTVVVMSVSAAVIGWA